MRVEEKLDYDESKVLFIADGYPSRAKDLRTMMIICFVAVFAFLGIMLAIIFNNGGNIHYIIFVEPILIIVLIVGYFVDALIFWLIIKAHKDIKERRKINVVVTENEVIGYYKKNYYYFAYYEINEFSTSNYLLPEPGVSEYLYKNQKGGKFYINIREERFVFCSDKLEQLNQIVKERLRNY